MKPDFTHQELRAYILANREDDDAIASFIRILGFIKNLPNQGLAEKIFTGFITNTDTNNIYLDIYVLCSITI